MRLAAHVDVLVVSEEAGVSKPDPGIFEIALRRSGAMAAEAVMIGDSWTNDVEGARAAGIRAVWFSRGGEPSPAAEVPAVYSLEPVPALLRLLLGDERERLARKESVSALPR